MKNELPNYNKKVGGYVVFNKDGKTAITNDGTKGGYFYGDSHQDPSNGISAIVDNDRPILVEGNEVIINKKTVQSDKVLTVKGTPKEILSTLNQMDGNGVAIGDEEAEILAKYRNGGKIPREKHRLYLGEEGGMGVSPKGMFESAVQMEKDGIDSETIRSITGWFRNPFDKLWRFEISDREAKINLSKIASTIKKVVSSKSEVALSLKDVYTNNELSKAYGKSIEELPFVFYYGEEDEGLGSLNIIPLAGKVFIKLNVYEFLRGNVGEVESTVAERGKLFISFTTHELQHAIQVREGLSSGGSVEQEYRKLLKGHKGVSEREDRLENDRKTREDILLEQARLNYLNHLGEIEASDSDVRKFFDKKTRIEIPPYSLINFNNEEVIVVPEIKIKFDEGGKIPREKHRLYLGEEGGMGVSPKGMFESAVQMEKDGIDSETIRSITGWFRNPFDKLWRFEISDNEMEIICTFTDKEIDSLKTDEDYFYKDLKDVIKHDELFKAYPRIKYLRVFFMNVDDKPEASLCTTEKGKIFIICNLKYERAFSNNRAGVEELGEREISDNRRSGEERKAKRYNTLHFRKVITHELQHAIQINEGLAEGGNPNVELKKIKANSGAIQSLTEKEQEYIATQRYLNKAGEIEAMSSDVRIDYNDLQRIRNKPYSEIAVDPKYFSSDLETKTKFRTGGELIKIAEGSYSRRGLWDNIRDNVGSGRKPTKQMLEQEAKIKSKYHLGGDMSKHLAPNGKPSNLTHEQWHLVRTPEFLDFFGDWINSPETASKVVDSNGEPLVVYHNSETKFNIFDKSKNKLSFYGEGIYFTNIKNEYISKGKNLYEVFLCLKEPFIIDFENKNQEVYIYKNQEFDTDEILRQKRDIEKGAIIRNPPIRPKDKNYFIGERTYYIAGEPNQIKLADGTNTTFDENNDDIRFKTGGSISKMTPSELKEFYDSPEGKKLDAQTYAEWKRLVNMTKSELEKFYNSVEGKEAGLTTSQAKEQGIDSGRESARWILKMKDIPYKEWTSNMWRWAKKQINFIKRMSGMKGSLYNDKGEKTRKHTALLIWGHNPEQKFKGGGDIKGYDNFKNPILINGFISNKKIDGKEIFLITYNSGGQEGLNVHQTMNPLAMLDAVEKKTGLHTNTLQVFIYEHTENSNRIETEEELEFLKDNYTVIIVDRDSVEFYNGHSPEQKFAGGGGIGGEVELELYQVRFDTDDDSEIKLVTTSYEDAKSDYEGATIGDFGDSEFNVSLEKKIDKYKFVYELDEDESIDDYPIEEYYDDSYYYELIEEGEFDNIENRVVTAFNSSSEDLLDEVQEWAKDKFGNYKYNTIDVYSEDDIKEENDSIGSIQLRIADHSQNESNLPYGIDRSLSVVIANKDATRGRFQQNRPQIYFDGNDSFDYVISEIENYIEDAKEYIQSKKFEKGGRLRKFRGGGELSQKALAVETNDLTDFVRKYFIKDGRIDVSDAMQELFGNKRGKSIADEYRKRIGLHKKGGLTISQLAHNLWEQHRDEVREDIDDSDFRNAVEEVLISEYGVSSMIKSLMEKSGESEQDRENEYWMNQFDEGDDEYYEDLSDEEVADYFRDMEGFERETYEDEDKKIIISGVEIPKEIDELFKEQYKLSYYYSFYGDILNSFPKDEMGLTKDSARATKEYKEVKQKYDLAKRKANEFNLSKEGKELSDFYSKIDRMSRIEVMKYYRDLAEELAKGTEHEMEHLDTLKKVAEGKLTPEEGVVETAETHISENPEYYEDLAKMEKENEDIKFAFNYSEKELEKHITNSELDDFVKNAKFNSTATAYNYPIPRRSGEDWHLYISIQKPSRMGRLHNKYWAYLYKNTDEGKDIKLLHKSFDTLKEAKRFVGLNYYFETQRIYDVLEMEKQAEQEVVEEESIPDLIEGLKVLAESLEGAEKKDLEDTIEGLKLLL